MTDFTQLSFWHSTDVAMMRQALVLAEQGGAMGEVPVGAVLVQENGQIIGTGYNRPISSNDPTAHAEIIAIRQACQNRSNYRLPARTTLYVTLEPCTMCWGALVHARVGRVIFGAPEPKAGVLGSQLNLSDALFYNHSVQVSGGLLTDECRAVLQRFFKQCRQQNKKQS